MRKTVLVIDDDLEFLDLLEAVLTQEGYRAEKCADPTEAHHVAQRKHPHLIIVDLLMPERSGWQVIADLIGDPLTAGIHIVVCTGALSAGSQQIAALRLWGCDVLLKPFEIEDLLSILAKAETEQQIPHNL